AGALLTAGVGLVRFDAAWVPVVRTNATATDSNSNAPMILPFIRAPLSDSARTANSCDCQQPREDHASWGSSPLSAIDGYRPTRFLFRRSGFEHEQQNFGALTQTQTSETTAAEAGCHRKESIQPSRAAYRPSAWRRLSAD